MTRIRATMLFKRMQMTTGVSRRNVIRSNIKPVAMLLISLPEYM